MSTPPITLTPPRSRAHSRNRQAHIAACQLLAGTEPAYGGDTMDSLNYSAQLHQNEQSDASRGRGQDPAQKLSMAWLMIDCVLFLVAFGLVKSSKCDRNNCDMLTITFMASFATYLTYLAGEIDETESALRVFLRLLSICFIADVVKLDQRDMQSIANCKVLLKPTTWSRRSCYQALGDISVRIDAHSVVKYRISSASEWDHDAAQAHAKQRQALLARASFNNLARFLHTIVVSLHLKSIQLSIFKPAAILTALASHSALVAANGSFTGGYTWSQVADADTIATARETFCSNSAGNFAADQTKTACADNFNSGNTINWSVHVNGVGTTLLGSDCDAALTIEIKACGHGSEQDLGRFHYKADPRRESASKASSIEHDR
ncbi:hypothetical protein AC579_5781 [Pseudocercospora musae]|uniref:Uncharacterized protein n=1 Tax=Pseudocercospora musae TaxID=113226 RepID=A0A139IR08_9PEZI|nr:hypothetical protein AC579_5781 [Pseudocercospora musae]